MLENKNFPILLKNTKDDSFELFLANGISFYLKRDSVFVKRRHNDKMTFNMYVDYIEDFLNYSHFEFLEGNEYFMEVLFKTFSFCVDYNNEVNKIEDENLIFGYFKKTVEEANNISLIEFKGF